MRPTTPVLAASPAEWLGTSWSQLGLVAASTLAVFTVVILLTRLSGLRSFSQMSAFDFAVTVAIGSLVASTASGTSTTLLNGVAALGLLYVVQFAIARARLRSGASTLVDNQPLLLVHEGEILHEHMRSARMAERDLRAKLRQAGIRDLAEVRAVVFETTADVSVITGDQPIDPWLLEGVRGVPVSSGRRAGAG